MSTSILQDKSYAFALRIVKLCEYLSEEKHEFVLSRKVLESGTAIGVLIEEARQGEDRSDFRQKLSIQIKKHSKQTFGCGFCAIASSLAKNKQARCSRIAKNSRKCLYHR